MLHGKTLAAPKADDLCHKASEIISRALRKIPEEITVLIEPYAPDLVWHVAGKPVHFAAHVDVILFVGYNSASEKQEFVSELKALLTSTLSPEVPPTLIDIVIHEVSVENCSR
jgi:4-oxalocrotonate tautomerase